MGAGIRQVKRGLKRGSLKRGAVVGGVSREVEGFTIEIRLGERK